MPVLTKGVRTPFVPKPGPLKSGRNVQSSDGRLNKRFHPYTRGIPMSGRSHNAIPSDHSSTGGISQLCKRRGSSASPFSIPNSCYMKTIERPAKKMRKQELPPNSGSSDPLGSEKGSQGEQATTTSGKANSRDSPPSSSRPRRRKFQLVPSRRGIPLIMPEAPMLGYTITVEEYEQVQTEWLKTVFKDKTGEWDSFLGSTQCHQPLLRGKQHASQSLKWLNLLWLSTPELVQA
ncbi:nuclear envelope pore membrane protein POM 121-like [Manis javanica]|uniref:nuclear envelope pore membrane protein POM 121-like n=2 Tax=Manis javanica TaxID=9974 RepID=UPI003C6D229C